MATNPAPLPSLGSVLVALQFALIVVLGGLAAPALLGGSAPGVAWVLLTAGIVLATWTLSVNRPGNFNIRPTPRTGGRLAQDGPYRWIRHPMYTTVIVCGAACASAGGSVWGWLATLALIGVLLAKASLEERLMMQAHPAYAAYRARTRGFV
ncbi:MAG: isoprenylcysteine carboxylmethyltransferase family protein, partial [Burkholderiaceae bacterium]